MGKIAGIFPVGTTGEQFVIAEWVPDPQQIERDLLAMANQFEDWTIPLTESMEAFRYSTETYFDTESDPSGVKWVPLSERTSRYKELHGYPPDILQRTGELKSAATGEGAWFIDERSVYFNAGALPDYGPIHLAGTRDLSEEHKEALTQFRTGQAVTSMIEDIEAPHGSGSGKALPRRVFIGANEGTIFEIEDAFVRYINGLADTWVGGVGVVRDPVPPLMGVNKLGTFPIIGFTKTGVPMLKTPHGMRFGRKL